MGRKEGRKGREGRKGVRYDMALDSLFLFFIFCKLVGINLIIVACCMEVSMGYVHRVPYR